MPSTPSKTRAQRNADTAFLDSEDASASCALNPSKTRAQRNESGASAVDPVHAIALQLQSVRQRIESLRIALLTPSQEELDQSLPSLEEAIGCLVSIEQELSGSASISPVEGIRLRIELQGLQKELQIVNRLIEHGEAFCQKWAKFLGAAEAGYVSTGQPAQLTAGGSLSLHG